MQRTRQVSSSTSRSSKLAPRSSSCTWLPVSSSNTCAESSAGSELKSSGSASICISQPSLPARCFLHGTNGLMLSASRSSSSGHRETIGDGAELWVHHVVTTSVAARGDPRSAPPARAQKVKDATGGDIHHSQDGRIPRLLWRSVQYPGVWQGFAPQDASTSDSHISDNREHLIALFQVDWRLHLALAGGHQVAAECDAKPQFDAVFTDQFRGLRVLRRHPAAASTCRDQFPDRGDHVESWFLIIHADESKSRRTRHAKVRSNA